MSGWSPDFENDLTQLLKDWLKSQGRTQADLRRSLRAASTRLPSILEVLERDYKAQGIQGLRLGCAKWKTSGTVKSVRLMPMQPRVFLIPLVN